MSSITLPSPQLCLILPLLPSSLLPLFPLFCLKEGLGGWWGWSVIGEEKSCSPRFYWSSPGSFVRQTEKRLFFLLLPQLLHLLPLLHHPSHHPHFILSSGWLSPPNFFSSPRLLDDLWENSRRFSPIPYTDNLKNLKLKIFCVFWVNVWIKTLFIPPFIVLFEILGISVRKNINICYMNLHILMTTDNWLRVIIFHGAFTSGFLERMLERDQSGRQGENGSCDGERQKEKKRRNDICMQSLSI